MDNCRTERERVRDLYSSSLKSWWNRFYFNFKWRAGSAIETCEEYVPKKGIIVDIGCGTGIFDNLLTLRSPERHVVGIDLDRKRIDIAKSTVGDRKNIEFHVEDAKDFELTECDCIILYDVLHHLDRRTQAKILKESHEKLRRGGVLLIKDIDREDSWKFLIIWSIDAILNLMRITQGVLCFQSPAQLAETLDSAGFHAELIRPGIKDFAPHLIIRCEKKEP